MSELRTTKDPDALMVTHALGSCIGLILYDFVQMAGGMIHYLLPQSEIAPGKAIEKPAMFADTGIPLLFEEMYKLGCKKANLTAKVVGAGKLCGTNDHLDIGHRNYTILRKVLWKNSVLITAEHIGGPLSRTVQLVVRSGQVTVKSQGKETIL